MGSDEGLWPEGRWSPSSATGPAADPRLVAPHTPPASSPEPADATGRPTARPAVTPALIADGPLGFTDILDGAFVLYRASTGLIVGITLAVLVPVQLLVGFLQRDSVSGLGLGGLLADPEAAAALVDGTGDPVPFLLGLVLVQGLLLPLLAGAYVSAAGQVMAGGQAGVGAVWRDVVDRAPALLGAWWLHIGCYLVLLAPALLSLGLGDASVAAAVVTWPIAAIGPALLVPLFVLAAPAVMIERQGPLAAIRRSAGLARRRYGRTLGVVAGVSFVAGLLSALISGIPEVIALAPDLGFSWALRAVGGVLSELVSGPLSAHAALLLLVDLRNRVEAADLIVRARARRPESSERAA